MRTKSFRCCGSQRDKQIRFRTNCRQPLPWDYFRFAPGWLIWRAGRSLKCRSGTSSATGIARFRKSASRPSSSFQAGGFGQSDMWQIGGRLETPWRVRIILFRVRAPRAASRSLLPRNIQSTLLRNLPDRRSSISTIGALFPRSGVPRWVLPVLFCNVFAW